MVCRFTGGSARDQSAGSSAFSGAPALNAAAIMHNNCGRRRMRRRSRVSLRRFYSATWLHAAPPTAVAFSWVQAERSRFLITLASTPQPTPAPFAVAGRSVQPWTMDSFHSTAASPRSYTRKIWSVDEQLGGLRINASQIDTWSSLDGPSSARDLSYATAVIFAPP